MSVKHSPLEFYVVTRDGRVFSIAHDWRGYGRREMRQHRNRYGYPYVRLALNGGRELWCVHRLVALAYLPSRPSPQHEIRHLNGDPADNRAENLAWGTRKENAVDKERHGRTSRGKRHSEAIRRALRRVA